MKFKLGQCLFVVAVLFSFDIAAYAQITRSDVLECGLADGSKFILQSTYKWSLIPVIGHYSRTWDRKDWNVSYSNRSRKISDVPITRRYSGTREENPSKENPSELVILCADFGLINGYAIIPGSYLQVNGKWFSRENIPWDRLSVDVGNSLKLMSAEQQAQMTAAGIKSSNSSHILPKNGRLVYEQPLHKANGFFYTLPVDAVYQSFSDDDGKTWSDPIVTTKAEIFEVGKSKGEQSFRARPITLNGTKIRTDFSSSNF